MVSFNKLIIVACMLYLPANLAQAYHPKYTDYKSKKYDRTIEWTVRGVKATGFNRLKGKPVMDLGYHGELGFETVGEYDADGSKAKPITRNTSANALLATFVDQEFLENFADGSAESKLPANVENVPLRNVGVNASPFGVDYFPAQPINETQQGQIFQPAQSLPADPITLSKWLKARGLMSFSCKANGENVVRMKLRKLLPNRMYSIWGFFDTSEELPFSHFGPLRPLGGVSNLVITDHRGSAEYKRILNFCPKGDETGEPKLSGVFVYFHSDQSTYGAVPSFIDEGRFPGATGHIALQFPVNATSERKRHRYGRAIRVSSDYGETLNKLEFTEKVFSGDPFFLDESAPSRVVKGFVATGTNKDINNQTLSVLGGGVGEFGFVTTAAYAPQGDKPMPLNQNTPDNAILATNIDFEPILARFGLFDREKFETEGKSNIPFHFTPIATDSTGLKRESLPGVLDVGRLEFSRSEPSAPITLGQFKRAEGIVKFSCPEGEMARAVMKFKRLMPNQYYNLFEWFQTGQPLGTFDILPQYVGGLPDAFVTNEYGEAELRTYINRCPPLESAADGIALIWVLVLRANHESHATTIVAPLHPRDARLPGEIGTAHMNFLIRATPIER